MKTAVEYLLEYCERENWSIPFDVEHTANEMEKEQMCDFAEQWFVCFGYKSVEEYYNETFNTKHNGK